MVVRQYRAEGPLTRLLLMVVAIDDADVGEADAGQLEPPQDEGPQQQPGDQVGGNGGEDPPKKIGKWTKLPQSKLDISLDFSRESGIFISGVPPPGGAPEITFRPQEDARSHSPSMPVTVT